MIESGIDAAMKEEGSSLNCKISVDFKGKALGMRRTEAEGEIKGCKITKVQSGLGKCQRPDSKSVTR